MNNQRMYFPHFSGQKSIQQSFIYTSERPRWFQTNPFEVYVPPHQQVSFAIPNQYVPVVEQQSPIIPSRIVLQQSYFPEINHLEQIIREEDPFHQTFQEDIIANAIKDMALYEEQIEKVRIQLAACPDFRISILFQQIDSNGTDKVFVNELQQGMKLYDVYADTLDIQLVIKQYSNREFLTQSDFRNIFFPITNIASNISRSSDEEKQNWSFRPKTKLIIKSFFKTILNAEVAAEFYRNDLQEKEINLKSAFDFINKNKNGVISLLEMKEFLQSNGLYLNQQILFALIRRFDTNGTGQIMYQEFVDQLMPKLQK